MSEEDKYIVYRCQSRGTQCYSFLSKNKFQSNSEGYKRYYGQGSPRIYDKFYDELKRGDWTQERARTATMIKQYFKGEFDCQKRFPKGDNEESFPPLRVLKLPKEGLALIQLQLWP